jgi:hypothetical protein
MGRIVTEESVLTRQKNLDSRGPIAYCLSMSEGGWRDAVVGIMFIWLAALLGVALAIGHELRRMDIQLIQLAASYSILDSEFVHLRSENFELKKQLVEFQAWRVHVTVASRMGWGQANRYIQGYPLEEVQ